ncbi:MAG: Xaa-Pro peptidase family protein [Oscillospiraceae bacterium]
MINKQLMVKLQNQLKSDGVDALMIAPSNDMKFLIGEAPYLCERFQAMMVKADGGYFYICNTLTYDEATDLMEGAKVYPWFDCDDFTLVVKSAFEENGLIGKKIAVNGSVRAFNLVRMMEKVNFTPVNGKDYLELTRIIKTPQELNNLRKSSLVVDEVFKEIITIIKPGMSEADVKDEISRLITKHGGVASDHGGIVAINANAALPHYFGESGVIGKNAVVEMDYGCTVEGMWSDITRTVFVGEVSERQREIYNLVLQANLAGEKAAVNGAYIPDVDAAARKIIEDGGYGKNFFHRLGHGIGYAGHEAPYIHGDYHMNLAPGMAFSCEPGIYIKDEIGIRIEDVVIINEKGETEVLNKCTKELIVIK